MADTRKYAQTQDFFLSGSGISLSATSITLTAMKFPDDSTNVTTTDIGSLAYAVIEPETSRAENISFTGITQNANGTATLTGVTRGLRFNDPYTANNDLRLAHAGGTTLRISNTAPFYSEFANKENNETINQVWTFATAATPLITDVPTTNTMAANKLYVDTVAIAGAPDASAVTKGITLLSVAPVAPTSPIAVGDNDTRVPSQAENNALVGDNGTPSSTNTYVTQTGLQIGAEVYAASASGNDTYAITLSPVPTAYVNGMHLRFKSDVGNTGAATLNVNSLGAINIQKNLNGTMTALENNDIPATYVAEVVYNSTGPVFELLNPAEAITRANAATLTAGAASDADALHTHPALTTAIDLSMSTNTSDDYFTYIIPANAWTNTIGTIVTDTVQYFSGAPTGTQLRTTTPLPATGAASVWSFSLGKTLRLKWMMRLADDADIYGWGVVIATADLDDAQTAVTHNARFVKTNNVWYATNGSGTVNTNTNISAFVVGDTMHTFGLIISSSSILYYVDGVLAATHTTNLPTSSTTAIIGLGTSAATASVIHGPVIVSVQA